MSAPSNVVQYNGITQVSADNLNSYLQFDIAVSQLRSFVGITNMMVYLQGFSSAGDGGQGVFYWNAANAATDDGGLTTVVPYGVSSGGWNRLNPLSVDKYTNTVIINAAGTLATGTIIMPSALFDGQYITFTSNQTITALTLTPNAGQTVNGTATTLNATTPVKFIYRLANKNFYRYI